MALGNQNQPTGKLYVLKIKDRDAEDKYVPVHFQVEEKGEDGKWAAASETRDVSGDLTQVVLGERTYEGKTTPTVKLFIKDTEKDETYLLDLRYNMLSRNLFNTLFTLEDFSDIKIGVYQSKPKAEGDKSYAKISVRSHGEIVRWKYDLSALPPIEKVKVGKSEITNYDNLNDFFLTELQALAIRVKNFKPGPKAPPKPAVVATPIADAQPVTQAQTTAPKKPKVKVASTPAPVVTPDSGDDDGPPF